MVERIVNTEEDRATLVRFLDTLKPPYSIIITKGRRRSIMQNRLQRLWLNEVAEQLGDRTPEEVRGEAKLAFGVPMLCAENEAFADTYDRIVKPLPYEQRLALMMEPLDLPVTRIMSTDQKTRYLDAFYRHFASLGLVLTDPDPFGLTIRRAA